MGKHSRTVDTLAIESAKYGRFDTFTSAVIANDLTKPSEAAFTVGDDASYVKLQMLLEMGNVFTVSVNGRLHLTGRVELNSVPCTPSDGSLVAFTIRTKMADAMYSSADPSVRVAKGTTLKQFILACYAPLGYVEKDFVWLTDVGRNLLTGRLSTGTTPTDIEAMNEEQAKVAPPETIYAAVDKHLARHGLMHWDSPDGRIAVGAPNDMQNPLYNLRVYNDIRARTNNVLSATRTQDWSQVPSSITVVGAYTTQAWTAAKVRSVHAIEGLQKRDDNGNLAIHHPVYIMDSNIRNNAFAERRAKQEATSRLMSYDSWVITCDGFAYRDDGSPINYGIDTVADVASSLIGGPAGAYLIHTVRKTRDPSGGDTTELTMVKRGVWRL